MKIDDRKVLPRWKRLYSVDKNLLFPKDLIREVLPQQALDWKINKNNITFAEDFICSAYIGGVRDKDVSKAAQLILSESKHRGVKEMASTILGDPRLAKKNNTFELNISYLRKLIKISPESPLIRLEMGYHYILDGQFEKAKKELILAQHLSNFSPEISRQIIRLFTHINETERAMSYSRTCFMKTKNPGLIASEISLSHMLETNSILASKAYNLSNHAKTLPRDKSESLAALVTLDLESGDKKSIKRAYKILKWSPIWNENSLAQLVWLQKWERLGLSKMSYEKVFEPYEVKARSNIIEAEVDEAIVNCRDWHDYQKFSSGPGIWGSYLLSTVKSDYQGAVDFIEPVVRSAKYSSTLLNNYAYALLKLDRLREAKQVISKIENLPTIEKGATKLDHTLLATMGLSKIKNDEVEEGDILYQEALKGFYKSKDIESAVTCRAAWLDTFNPHDQPKIEKHTNLLKEDLKKCKDKLAAQIASKHLK